MTSLGIGLLGLGTVGSGVVHILKENVADIRGRLGGTVEVKRIAVRDIEKERAIAVDAALLTTDVQSVLEDPEIAIIVELIGGTTDAADYVLRAIGNGKHVVTANKALLATKGKEIFDAASRNGVDVFFEGAVGGGIPIVRALRESFASERILGMIGIVNGTTNFILSKMTEEGAGFEDALRQAQALGFAEADPTADVDGHDAAQKLAILASLGFGTRLIDQDVHVEGIRDVTTEDIAYAKEFGFVTKLVAIAERVGASIALRVHPAWVPMSSLLAHVGGPYNAVLLRSEALGTSLLYGQGAGQLPTGSAVAADVIELARNIRIGATGRVPHLATRADAMLERSVISIGETRSAYFLRFTVSDQPGALGKIATCLGEKGVSLRTVHQAEGGQASPVPVVALTHPAKEADLRAALESVDKLEATRGKTRSMRIVDA